MVRVLEVYDVIMDIILPTLGEERRQSDLCGVAIIALGVLAWQVARAEPHENLK